MVVVHRTVLGSDHGIAYRAEAQDLLDDWADALRSGDADDRAELVDESAGLADIEWEQTKATNLRALPLQEFSFHLSDRDTDPDVQMRARRLSADAVWSPVVFLEYAISGIDREPTRKSVAATLVRRGEAWRLLTTRGDVKHETWSAPWEFGPLLVTTADADGAASIVVGHPEQSASVKEVADELPAATRDIANLVGAKWPRAVLVVVTATPEEFGEMVGQHLTAGETAAAAISDATAVNEQPTGQRIVFSPEAFSRLGHDDFASKLRHELMHVAMRSRVSEGAPLWITEGLAEYAATRGNDEPIEHLAPSLARGVSYAGPPAALPSDAEFGGDRFTSELAYEAAWSFCVFVAQQFGEVKLVELHDTLAAQPAAELVPGDAIRKVLGMSYGELVSRWGGWLTAQVYAGR